MCSKPVRVAKCQASSIVVPCVVLGGAPRVMAARMLINGTTGRNSARRHGLSKPSPVTEMKYSRGERGGAVGAFDSA